MRSTAFVSMDRTRPSGIWLGTDEPKRLILKVDLNDNRPPLADDPDGEGEEDEEDGEEEDEEDEEDEDEDEDEAPPPEPKRQRRR